MSKRLEDLMKINREEFDELGPVNDYGAKLKCSCSWKAINWKSERRKYFQYMMGKAIGWNLKLPHRR